VIVSIADGVACGDEQQFVFLVIADDGTVAEGILKTMREKKMRLHEGEFLHRIGEVRGVEDFTGGNPQSAVCV
jgi:hypothetical protein